MESIIRNFNPDLNFWEINPTFKVIALFKKLYNEDKSKNKASSSKLMWAIALFVDPNNANSLRNSSTEDRKILIAEDYLNDKKFNWEQEDIQLLIKEYEKKIVTSAEREFLRLTRKMEERGDFIEKTPYRLDEYDPETEKVLKGTAEQLDKMMVNTIKIYEQLDDIKSLINKEQADTRIRGNGVESASEKGEI